jgi:hypothetical protein
MSASDTVIDTRRERMDGRETEDELKGDRVCQGKRGGVHETSEG